MSYNKVLLIGTVITEPIIAYDENGKYAAFEIEVKNDEISLPVKAYSVPLGIVEKYVENGSEIFIEGSLFQDTVGTMDYTYIHARVIQLCMKHGQDR